MAAYAKSTGKSVDEFAESAHEVALNYARLASAASQGRGKQEAHGSKEEEVLRLAAAEGLKLRKDDGAECGYRGVSCDKRYREALQQGVVTSGITVPHKCQVKTKEKCRTCFPFRATIYRGGKQVSLGNYGTAAEAGLAFARAASARALEGPSVGPPPLPPGWTLEKQGKCARQSVYFGPAQEAPVDKRRNSLGRCRARSVAEAWALARQEEARRVGEAAREQAAREQMEMCALPFLAEAALRSDPRTAPVDEGGSEGRGGEGRGEGGGEGGGEDGGEGGGEDGGEGDEHQRRACAKACAICVLGVGMCMRPGHKGHLRLAEASCPWCSSKLCKKGKRPDLRRCCLKRGKQLKGERHWPASATSHAPPVAIEHELGAPVAIMGLLMNRS